MSFEAGLGGVAGFKDRLEAVRAALLDEDALLSVSRAATEMILKEDRWRSRLRRHGVCAVFKRL